MEPAAHLRRLALGLVAVALLALAGASSAHATAFTISSRGATPDVAVDDEGTAHVVWNEVTPNGSADILHYCKVPRGVRHCTGERTFVPPDGDPYFNKEFSRPRVVLPAPDEVMIFTSRYPNSVTVNSRGDVTPNCNDLFPFPATECYTSSNKTWSYRSFDGGANFGGAHVFDHLAPGGDMGVLQFSGGVGGDPGATGLSPWVMSTTETTTGGTFFTAAPTDGYERQNVNLGDEGPNRAYFGTIAALHDENPIVAFDDLNSNVYVRSHLNRDRSLLDIGAWTRSVTLKGDEPRLTGGPGGVYLLYKPRAGITSKAYALRKWNGRRFVGPAVPVSDSGDDTYRDVFEDDSGRVHAIWVNRDAPSDLLRYRFSTDGRNFSAPISIARGAGRSMYNTGIAAADDGGGFASYSTTFSGNGSIKLAPFGTTAKRTLIDVSIAGMDVTQGIQTRDFPVRDPDPSHAAVFVYPGIDLAELHSTVVRVYANSRRPLSGAGVPPMTIYGYHNGRQLGGGALLPDTVPTSLPVAGPSSVTDAQRVSTDQVYTFTLPWQWAQGEVELRAEINPPGLTPAVAECRLCHNDNAFRINHIVFKRTSRIRFLPVAITVNGTNPNGYPDPQAVFRPGREAYPLPFDLPDYRGTLDMSDLANATQVKVESCFLGIWPCSTSTRAITQSERLGFALDRLNDWASDHSSAVYPIGVFRDNSTLGGVTNGGGQLFGGTQPLSIVRDTRPLTSVAHEIGHGLGRVHAGLTCGSNSNGQVGEAWPPNNDGALDGIGLDLSKPPPYAVLDPAAKGAPATFFDLMSYCGNTNEAATATNAPDAWMSIKNWQRDLALNAPQAYRVPGSVARSAAREPSAHPARARTLRAVAMVPVSGKPSIIGVAPDAGGPTPIDQTSTYRFVTRDRTGKALATSGALVVRENVEQADPIVLVTGRVPAAGAASVDLVQNGTAVAQQVASKASPRVRILAPRTGAKVGRGGSVTLRWRATDADHADRLKTIVQYSANGGRSYTTLAIGPNRNSIRLRAALLSASRHARVRVRVQDGFHETLATSGSFISAGAPPQVRISSPARGTRIAAGAGLALRGDAYDDTGRALRGRAFTWLDGGHVLARGPLVVGAGLGAATHRIVLRVRDAHGRTHSASIRVRVTPRRPQFLSVRGPARLGRKARSVVIKVSATFTARLTAGRTRTTVGRALKRVRVRVKPGRSLLELPLTLSSGRLVNRRTLAVPRH